MQTNSAYLNKTILMATYDIVVAYTQNMPHGTDLAEVTRSVGEALRQSAFASVDIAETAKPKTKTSAWTPEQRKAQGDRNRAAAKRKAAKSLKEKNIKMGFAWRTPAYFYGTGNYVAPKF